MRKYRPSNGTEGMCFMEQFCDHCIHERYNQTLNDDDKKCTILSNTMTYDVTDEKYPVEWTYNEQGEPICTAHVRWDWDNNGDPDDRNNPKAPIPDNPNQLVFPFILEEIEHEHHVQTVKAITV